MDRLELIELIVGQAKRIGCTCEPDVSVTSCQDCGGAEHILLTHTDRCRLGRAHMARWN